MVRPTDFSKYLGAFLTEYLPLQRNVSKHTLASYSDSFRLFLKYCQDVRGIKIERLRVSDITPNLIMNFLDWIVSERNCSTQTRNQRLAAIHAFFSYIQSECPALINICQAILCIPTAKCKKPHISYLTVEEIKKILQMPDCHSSNGRRDLTILSVLYDTGARVSEVINMRVRDVRLDNHSKVTLHGKMRKTRDVPTLTNTALLLNNYIREQKLDTPQKLDHPLFFNRQNKKLTRVGVTYLLKKYAEAAEITQKVTPHVFRHSKAMHLLEAGINIIYIRDLLGHDDVTTTQIYAKASIETKREVLEQLSSAVPVAVPSWAKDADMLNWLKSFGKESVRNIMES